MRGRYRAVGLAAGLKGRFLILARACVDASGDTSILIGATGGHGSEAVSLQPGKTDATVCKPRLRGRVQSPTNT